MVIDIDIVIITDFRVLKLWHQAMMHQMGNMCTLGVFLTSQDTRSDPMFCHSGAMRGP